MAREFQVRREQNLPAAPEQVWHAVATGAGNLGWLYRMEIEPRLGGAVSRGGGTVVEWEPPRHFAAKVTRDDGFSNTLSYHIERLDGGTSRLHMGIHWVHEGTVDAGWDTRADAAEKHVDFYQHSLAEYLTHFAGRPAVYVKADRPEPTADPGEFAALRRRLGLADGTAVGERLSLDLPGGDGVNGSRVDVVVDYLSRDFVGLRGRDALYRFFDGSSWNWPIWVGHHLFAESADEEKAVRAWGAWLNGA
ncbi:SRPBCC domain-containing protein [Streptomyces kaniharaensis]|uniref:SRPBCC domain-containing protein n=1 Tax=Streptomyces kaniharaensis TaxID=212423 RepID=A0A6N7KZC8_9ACTN|nr:SRPBCC domain-containing protein [Streptomyces kaniharaensis]MQS17002.1 SRPBCC domain-containing protein [Streptomyces kaniharaensis]